MDLGVMPPSNAYLSKEDLEKPEPKYPLRLLVCTNCWLVQTEDFVGRDELFNSEYAYFSSTSKSWLEHAAKYCKEIIPQLGLGSKSLVVEIASNDGYLLKNILGAGISCLGIEPTASTAATAEALGISVMREFFGEKLGQDLSAEGKQADLIVGNNVFAHVPDINDFAKGLKALLKPKGTITLEFPHLMKMIELNQFDTAYHEHFSYLSFGTVVSIFSKNGLNVFDVEKLGTHGGSLRVYAQRSDTGKQPVDSRVERLVAEESNAGMTSIAFYKGFQEHAQKVKNNFLTFLIEKKKEGKLVVGYGAAAKGNTLLNFAGVKSDLIKYVVDRSPHKQGKYMPGSRIPIVSEDRIKSDKPDYVVIFPWNLSEEIAEQLSYLSSNGTRFVTAVPQLLIFK